jgi:hypothetical protein
MAPRLILALVVVVFSADCGKRAENSSSAPPSAPGPSSGQVIANAPATDQGNNAAASEAAWAAVLGELTQALRKFSFERQRLPKTFSEVVAAGYVKDMPPAPPGRKFEIDPKTVRVVLVKQ